MHYITTFSNAVATYNPDHNILELCKVLVQVSLTTSKKEKYRNRLNRSSRPEVFYKIGVLKNFAKIHRKIPMLESFFNKVTELSLQLCLKRDPGSGVFL